MAFNLLSASLQKSSSSLYDFTNQHPILLPKKLLSKDDQKDRVKEEGPIKKRGSTSEKVEELIKGEIPAKRCTEPSSVYTSRKKRSWTEEENNILQGLINQGYSNKKMIEIASASLQRTKVAVSSQINLLRAGEGHSKAAKHDIENKELRVLMYLVERGASSQQIEETLTAKGLLTELVKCEEEEMKKQADELLRYYSRVSDSKEGEKVFPRKRKYLCLKERQEEHTHENEGKLDRNHPDDLVKNGNDEEESYYGSMLARPLYYGFDLKRELPTCS
ncbi:hypothetical protein PHSC3_001159 [Chlamydiales bacterium STE3]|nr:hypothetical protein PHSC3_001159 [Chlamydiales bacterium STE3]